MSKTSFGDPTSLERAAVALRELNKSPHAKEAILAQIQSDQARQAKYQLDLKQSEIQKIKTYNHEQRLTIDKQKETNKQLAEFNDALDRKKWIDKLKLQEESQERIRQENEQSLQKQEEIRRETYQFQLKKQLENDEKKLRLKQQLDSEQFRKDFDLYQQQIITKSQIENQGNMDIHKLYIKTVSDTSNYLMNSKQAVWTLAKYTLFLSGAYFLSKQGIQLTFRQIEAKFNKPILVRETSRFSIKNFHQYPQYFISSYLKSAKQKQNEIFSSMVLNPALSQKLQVISQGLMNKRKSNVPLRNFLFYGPPGTGKTLFAKQVATKSGLHYAIVSGSDIEKLGPLAASEIDKLFLWAQSSKKGTIIFIDEAESVFYRRENYPNSPTTNTLSTLLAQTSGGSSKVSLFMASNLPQRLDRAALDRMDSIIEFGFQEPMQRKEMILKGLNRISSKHNFARDIFNRIFNYRTITHNISEQFIDLHIVPKFEGLSARQIDKFIYALHDQAYNLQSNQHGQVVIDEQIASKVLEETLKQFNVRKNWTEI